MFLDVALDRVLKVGDGLERATADALSGDNGKEVFHGVEPGTGCRGEMEDPTRMICEPLDDLGMLVRGIVVGDSVDDLARWYRAFDRVEKFDKFLMSMLLHAAADDGAVEDVESGEQCGRAVTLIVVGHGTAFPWLQRQSWLGAVESLDLAFLVDGDHDGMGRRMHVETDDILDFLSEGGIVGFFEGPDAVGLEAAGIPDPLYSAQTDADCLGDGAPRPMRHFTGRLAARQGQDPGHRFWREGSSARLARLVTQQPADPFLGEALLPAPYVRTADAAPARHLQNGQFSRRQKNDIRSLDVFERGVTVDDDRGQALAVFGGKQDADGLSHTERIAWFRPLVNPLFASMH